MRDPDRRDIIPDERTEEEELEEQIEQVKVDLEWHDMQMRHGHERLNKLKMSLQKIRIENANFLVGYCPGAIGLDPEDQIEDDITYGGTSLEELKEMNKKINTHGYDPNKDGWKDI